MKTKKSKESEMFYCILKSPVGNILIAGDHRGLKFINFQDGPNTQPLGRKWKEDSQFFQEAIQQFHAYFGGRLTQFRLPLAPEGTSFQQKVWKALKMIPYGKTVSYGEIARRIGNPKASRAVGAANGQNPLSIIIPCHRVIGQTGDLVGHGGGLPIKELLLEYECCQLPLLENRRNPPIEEFVAKV